MKVKDLIKELSALDPESVVDIDAEGALFYVDQSPGYYDGHYTELIEDPALKPYYSVVGMRFSTKNQKVRLKTLSLEDIIWECKTKEEMDKLVFEFEGLHESTVSKIQKDIDRVKQDVLKYFEGKD